MLRVVVDTNVWVSALINPRGFPARMLKAFYDQRFELVLSDPLLEELANVVSRSGVARRIDLSSDELVGVLVRMRATSDFVEVFGIEPVCRDPDDDMVIETVIRGDADVLVTRDDDLKGASEVADYLMAHGKQVLTVNQFLALLARGSDSN